MNDDLTVARGALAQARKRNIEMRLQIKRCGGHVAMIEAALQREPRPPDADFASALYYLKQHLDFYTSEPALVHGRINGADGSAAAWDVEPVGLFRAAEPPPPPQLTGAIAIVCSCLVWLRNAADMRQHWETGCFDGADYELPVAPPADPSVPQVSRDPEEEAEWRAIVEKIRADRWIKGY
jgi:hypothetical protein